MLLRDYTNILTKRWWIIALTAFAAAVAAFVVGRILPDEFRAEARYQVVSSRNDYSLTLQMPTIMNQFRETALARNQLERVSQQLQLDRSASWMAERVAIQSRPDELIMVVQADAESPAQAMAMAQAIGDNMAAEVTAINALKEGSDKINLRLLQPANEALPAGVSTRVLVLAAGVLGLFLGLLLAFVIEYLDDTLKNPQDVERFVGLTTLGAIPLADAGRDTRAARRSRWVAPST